MTILFLDFDGVFFTLGGCVHSRIESGNEKHPKYELDPVSLSLVKRLTRDFPEIKIVVSSTWRLGSSLDELREILGPELGKLVIDKTPSTREGYRGTEIDLWLKRNKNLSIKDIVILDDDSDMQPWTGYLFQTDSYNGFQATDWLKIEAYLKMTNLQKKVVRVKKVLRTFVRHAYYDWKFRFRMWTWRSRKSWVRMLFKEYINTVGNKKSTIEETKV